jgi:hypothetical protein
MGNRNRQSTSIGFGSTYTDRFNRDRWVDQQRGYTQEATTPYKDLSLAQRFDRAHEMQARNEERDRWIDQQRGTGPTEDIRSGRNPFKSIIALVKHRKDRDSWIDQQMTEENQEPLV